MSKSVVVVANGNKFKVLVCYVQRGIEFSSSVLANREAQRLANEEHINKVILYKKG